MLRLEQVRAEILERVERLDRRLGQMELRLIRIDQHVDELAEIARRLQREVAAGLTELDDSFSHDLDAQR